MAIDPASAIVFGDELFDALGPLAVGEDNSNPGVVRFLSTAVGRMFGETEFYARARADGTQGWSVIFDIDQTSDDGLDFLAYVAGVSVPAAADAATKRALIKRSPARDRGTLTSIVLAAKEQLTGEKFLRVIERDGNAYRLSIYARTAQVPDAGKLSDAIKSQKPAGIKLNLVITEATTYNELNSTYDALTGNYNSL